MKMFAGLFNLFRWLVLACLMVGAGGALAATYPLSADVSGNGSGGLSVKYGFITMNLAGSFNLSINSGTSVSMTAVPDTGSTFSGWSGACTGTGTCSFTMTSAKSVMAKFTLNAAVPNAPTIGTVTPGNRSAVVAFTASGSSSTISGYTATCGSIAVTGTASPITVTGLTNGTAYSCSVTASNSAGTSTASSTVSVTPCTVPDAPTIGTVSVGNTMATVNFTPPTNTGGSDITGYILFASPGSLTASGTASPITMTGLTNGTTYSFTVKALNGAGVSAASAVVSDVPVASPSTTTTSSTSSSTTTSSTTTTTFNVSAYLPLQTGNTWTLNEYASDTATTVLGQKVVQVGSVTTVNGISTYKVTGLPGVVDATVYLTSDASGIRWHGSQLTVSGLHATFQELTPITLIDTDVGPNSVYSSSNYFGSVRMDYATLTNIMGTYEALIEVGQIESVTVPAGTFLARHVKFAIKDTIDDPEVTATNGAHGELWLAEGVGIVKAIHWGDSLQYFRLASTNVSQTVPSSTTSTSTTTTYLTSTTTSTTTTSTTTTLPGTIQVGLLPGWNLIGNGVESAIDVANALWDATKVSAVWKWVASSSYWAFYSPTLSDGGKAYAADKGYDALTTIQAGEGFWVNAKAGFTLTLPTGAMVTSSSFSPETGHHALGKGWSLIAAGDSPTPAVFNRALSSTSTPPEPGVTTVNFTTLWAWDAAKSGWYFWAPGLFNDGSLTDYSTQKGYLNFATLPGIPLGTISPTTGFWVNRQ